ncbi:MAG: hypothetical protein WBO97_01825, partial [Tepidiformaceae bacterium]
MLRNQMRSIRAAATLLLLGGLGLGIAGLLSQASMDSTGGFAKVANAQAGPTNTGPTNTQVAATATDTGPGSDATNTPVPPTAEPNTPVIPGGGDTTEPTSTPTAAATATASATATVTPSATSTATSAPATA